MSEFFKSSNGPTSHEENAAYSEHYQRLAQEAVLQKAQDLKEPLEYLWRELERRHTPKDSLVVSADTISSLKKVKNKTTGKMEPVADKLLIPTGKAKQGWAISTAKTRHTNHAVILMEDGSLRLGDIVMDKGGNPDSQDDVEAKHYLIGLYAKDPADTVLNLDEYPVNPLFLKENYGYKSTYGVKPDLEIFREGNFAQNAPESRVLINLQEIEADLRRNGQDLLGINRST